MPAGSINTVDVYVLIDKSITPVLVGQVNASKPSSSGVYGGTLTFNAIADGQAHDYRFYSVGTDDQGKVQATPAMPDATFSNITYTSPLAVSSLVVEKGISERSFIEYLDADFNQTTTTSAALEALQAGLGGTSKNAFVELLWYGENLTASSTPLGSVNLFNAGTTATVSLVGNDLSINFGANGITGLLTETGVSGTGKPTTNFGDGWYALGIDPTGNASNGQVFWEPFFRLFGSASGNETVSGPYTAAGTDAYAVYHAEGESGSLLNADVDGSGAVNSKDLAYTIGARGDSVGGTAPSDFPAFQLFAGASAALPGQPAVVTQSELQSLMPAAVAAWRAAGLGAADLRRLETVPVQVASLARAFWAWKPAV